ncbi:cell division protein FtsA [Chloroflexota bacterium]
MSKDGNIACIDIGSTKISVLLANVNDRDIVQILATGVAPSLGVQRGVIVDIDDARRSILEAIDKVEGSSGLKVNRALIGFSGKHIGSLNNRVAMAIDRRDHLVTPAALKRGLVSIHKITFPQDRRMVHVIPRRYFIDGVTGIRNPIGMHGFRLDMEAHIVTGGLVYIQNLRSCLEAAGVEIVDIVVNPIACGEAVLDTEDREDGVILADIGGGTTDIAVYGDGTVWHTSVIPVGGIQITKDISQGLGIPFSVAEELKIKYGKLLPGSEGWTETVRSETKEKYSVSQEDLCYIIRARIEEILRMILLKIPHSEYTPASVVLTGGTAKLGGMEEFAQQIMGFPVRVEAPKGIHEADGSLNDPIYAASAGLLLWGASHAMEERGIPTGGINIKQILKRLRGIRLPKIPFTISRPAPKE